MKPQNTYFFLSRLVHSFEQKVEKLMWTVLKANFQEVIESCQVDVKTLLGLWVGLLLRYFMYSTQYKSTCHRKGKCKWPDRASKPGPLAYLIYLCRHLNRLLLMHSVFGLSHLLQFPRMHSRMRWICLGVLAKTGLTGFWTHSGRLQLLCPLS